MICSCKHKPDQPGLLSTCKPDQIDKMVVCMLVCSIVKSASHPAVAQHNRRGAVQREHAQASMLRLQKVQVVLEHLW
jgi:hypothetical protein